MESCPTLVFRFSQNPRVLFASAPSKATLPGSAIQAAVNEAHRSGKPVFAHPNTGADVLAAVHAGVDIIAHTTPHSGPWDETLLKAMKERGVALIPTLTIWKYYMRHDRISAQEPVAATELGQLRAWLAVGGTVLFGNDLGAVDYDPTEEYALMSQAGMSFRQILASLTTAPAERFGQSRQLGRIAAALQADLVVLKDDPSRNIRALAAVRYTLRDGRIIYRVASDIGARSPKGTGTRQEKHPLVKLGTTQEKLHVSNRVGGRPTGPQPAVGRLL